MMKPLREWRCVVLATALTGLVPSVGIAASRPPLTDAPVIWWEDDRRDVPTPPAERDPNLLRSQMHDLIARPPGRHLSPDDLVKTVRSWFGGARWSETQNPNVLDEVPNSSWFVNRIGLFPMSPEECAKGAGRGTGPSPDGPWVVVSAKTEGVTPGFNIKDSRGDVYVIKFDPPGFLGMTVGVGAISERILHAAGYHVPEDVVVTFTADRLVLGEGVKVRESTGKRTMTQADLEAILGRTERLPSGEHLAIASKFLAGKPVGPFDFEGRRRDDPNDRIDHDARRELRGLRIIAAWINHFDTKQQNTLDMWVEEDGRHYVKHHLIDFASTLGAGATGVSPKNGWEYEFDAPLTLKRLLTLGLVEDDWRRIQRPEGLPEVGYFDVDRFDPMGFDPLLPNTAFAQLTDRDGYWAAKIISAFRDEQLRAICREARFRDPRSAEWIADVLGKRRDVIARRWFERVCPIDFFRVEDGKLEARDLGVERGIWPAASSRVEWRSYPVDAKGRPAGKRGEWTTASGLSFPIPEGPPAHPFQAFEFRVGRGGASPGPAVVAYVARTSGRVVGVER